METTNTRIKEIQDKNNQKSTECDKILSTMKASQVDLEGAR